MKLSPSTFCVAAQLLSSFSDGASTRNLKSKSSKGSKGSKGPKGALPEIGSLMDVAFPMWEVDDSGNRVETKPCTVGSCEWNPFYVTKRYDGLHPDFGGHPTDIDVNYAFFGASPFGGQPYSGTPHHCAACDGDDIMIKDCPKIETLTDKGPSGPGHVPPHISLASLTWCVHVCDLDMFGMCISSAITFFLFDVDLK